MGKRRKKKYSRAKMLRNLAKARRKRRRR